MPKKIYAVRKGRKTGIFNNWDDCKKNVEGYSGAEYKGFLYIEESESYINDIDSKKKKDLSTGYHAFVDGSFNVKSKEYSAGVVIVKMSDEQIEKIPNNKDLIGGYNVICEISRAYKDAEGSEHRNVSGEIKAAMLAIEYCKKNDIQNIQIHHDYEGICKWADGLWKTNIELTKSYRDYVKEARKSINISFIKVKAHSGNILNERADELAKSAIF